MLPKCRLAVKQALGQPNRVFVWVTRSRGRMQVKCAAPRRSHSHWFGKCRDANPRTSWLAFLKVRHVWHFVRNWTWDWCKLMDRFKVQVNKSFREPVTAANRIIVLNVGEVRLLGLKTSTEFSGWRSDEARDDSWYWLDQWVLFEE